jgi:hypothetical protein
LIPIERQYNEMQMSAARSERMVTLQLVSVIFRFERFMLIIIASLSFTGPVDAGNISTGGKRTSPVYVMSGTT